MAEYPLPLDARHHLDALHHPPDVVLVAVVAVVVAVVVVVGIYLCLPLEFLVPTILRMILQCLHWSPPLLLEFGILMRHLH